MSQTARRLPRWSMRFSVALLVAVVVVAPLLLVAAWLGVERRFESAMKHNAAFTVDEAVRALDLPPVPASTGTSSSGPPGQVRPQSAVEAVARRHRVRLRLLDEQGHVFEDYDYDSGRDLSERAGGIVLRPDGDHAALALDDWLGSVGSRPEFRTALEHGSADGCEDLPEASAVVCYAARTKALAHGKRIVHVQDGSERPVSALYELRFQLGRLTLVVLPFALLLAVWVGRRVVGPLEALRDQVLHKVRETRPKADLKAPDNAETEQLAQAFNTLLERLEARRIANEAFVADLVHEFKNPVATIRACGESLESSTVNPERAERLARLLHESSTRLDTLVSQFLELARAEAGMLEEAWEELDLAALTRARVARARDDERWASLRFEVEASEPARVRAVAERLETVLDNLLANAASFAGAGGTVHVIVDVTPDRAKVLVSDDGPGIAPEDVPHVFERFFTTRRHDKGTGLGLALVRAVVEGHGGSVAVSSRPGHGATFSATFPRASA